MVYNGKTTFCIDGTTIHSSLNYLPNCKDLPSLRFDCLDILILKVLQITIKMVLDEISMVGNKILKFVDQNLRSIKCMHTNYFGHLAYLSIITTSDFYRAQLIIDTPIC
jgi:hypothetical protein